MGRKTMVDVGEDQGELFEVEGEEAKLVARHARAYNRAKQSRLAALEEEGEKRDRLMAVVQELKYKPGPDGTYRIRCGGLLIVVKPGNARVKVSKDQGDVDVEEDGDDE